MALCSHAGDGMSMWGVGLLDGCSAVIQSISACFYNSYLIANASTYISILVYLNIAYSVYTIKY